MEDSGGGGIDFYVGLDVLLVIVKLSCFHIHGSSVGRLPLITTCD